MYDKHGSDFRADVFGLDRILARTGIRGNCSLDFCSIPAVFDHMRMRE